MSETDIENFEFGKDGYTSYDIPGDSLILNLEGFEGPLHILLVLARAQKVDITTIAARTPGFRDACAYGN